MKKKGKIKLVLFPANYEARVINEHMEEMKDYEINAIVTYKENNLDAQENNIFTNDIEKALLSSDALVLCDNVQKMGQKAYLNRVHEAKQHQVPIYISSFLYHWLGAESFSNIETVILNKCSNEQILSTKKLNEVTCPVLSILGDGENCDKFPLLLTLKELLERREYKVLAISGNPLAKLFGCETLPDYLYADNISMPEKVKKANRYIFDLTERTLPDIVLISHPSGIMTLNDYEHNYFGEISYILSNAVVSDYGIFCTYFSKYYTEKYIEKMKKMCQQRLGVDIIKFYICNQTYTANTEEEKVEYHFYHEEFCKENISSNMQNNENVLLPKDMEAAEGFIDELISLLSENPDII